MLSVSSLSSSTPVIPPGTPLLDTLNPQRQDVTQGRFLFPPDANHQHLGRGHAVSFHPDEIGGGSGSGGALFTDAFALACQLLVEFCSFPRYQSSLPQVSGMNECREAYCLIFSLSVCLCDCLSLSFNQAVHLSLFQFISLLFGSFQLPVPLIATSLNDRSS